jgi:3-hydroxyacyl-CoA dehydrogenase
VRRVAIIGSGLIGRSWSMVFARAGWDVALWDPAAGVAEAALGHVAAGLLDLAAHGLVDDPTGAAARVRAATELADAVEGAAYVQECAPEVLEAKRAVFAELDAVAAPDTILASSSSAIVASRFTESLAGRARCLVAHPVNPPHLVPLVELSGAPWTAPDTVARARELLESIGQVPIVVQREIDGFILNRLQGALLAEAFRLVADGYVTPADLDKTVADGLGLRWSFLGPFATMELNAPGGLADYCARYGGLYAQLATSPAGSEAFTSANIAEVVAAWDGDVSPERIADRSRWRDRRLAALIAHKRAQPPAGA